MHDQEKIDGKHIYIRSLTKEDVTEKYLGWLQDTDVNRFLETRHTKQSLQTITDFVNQKNVSELEYLYGIFTKNNKQHIGNIKLGPIISEHSLADLSLFIGDKTQWGKGYAKEAISLLVSLGFDSLKLHKISAGMYAENQASFLCFSKLGWEKEAVLKRHYFLDGSPSDIIIMSITAEHYKLIKKT